MIPETFSSASFLPKKPKAGYVCQPSFDVLEKMTIEDLKKVENFTVSNEYGSVQFIGETDLTSVDLADVITISLGICDVYEGEKHQKTKPAVGEKLNRPALITLYNM